MQVDKGLPLMRVGTLVGTPLNSLVVLKDGPVKSIRDLKGRKIGYSVGGFEEALLRAMLGKYGLKLSDVTLINVNFSLSPALMAGKVDAVVSADAVDIFYVGLDIAAAATDANDFVAP